jgi:DnaJ-class molecular chaperone
VTALIVIIIVVAFAWWVSPARRHPVRRCPSCHGSKKNAGSNDERWGLCRRCKGTGEVRRFGSFR